MLATRPPAPGVRRIEVGLDSQCLSYLIDALQGGSAPTDLLADQKVALVRLFMYRTTTLWTVPRVRCEFERIKDPTRRALHASWTNVHFGVLPVRTPPALIQQRLEVLEPFHRDADDRRILAEAEAAELGVLLSFDGDFVKHLGPHACIRLVQPSAYWTELGIPPGTDPPKVPTKDNPLARESWWRW